MEHLVIPTASSVSLDVTLSILLGVTAPFTSLITLSKDATLFLALETWSMNSLGKTMRVLLPGLNAASVAAGHLDMRRLLREKEFCVLFDEHLRCIVVMDTY
mmetsp:Transcript_5318/g.7690  ORF Transcript_5318/g.7690 Transcript_5318/m.7690 type:complete len:102 (+) Transcript_5318:41-346(+)